MMYLTGSQTQTDYERVRVKIECMNSPLCTTLNRGNARYTRIFQATSFNKCTRSV